MNQFSSTFRTVFFTAALYCLASFQLAPSLPAQENDECEITVREIVAENTGRGVDDKLNDIGRDLEKLSYSTFRLEQTHSRKLGVSVSGEFALLGDNKLLLTPEGFEEGKIRLKVKLTPKSGKQKVFETTLRIANGGTFIIAGPAHGGGVLFLAFTAKQ